jgi:hypothetical protein
VISGARFREMAAAGQDPPGPLPVAFAAIRRRGTRRVSVTVVAHPVPVVAHVVPVVAAVVAVVTPVAVAPAVVVTGHRRAGYQAELLSGHGRGGEAHGRRGGRGDALFGVGGCACDQGAGGCDGHQASGGVQLFSHVVSLSPGICTRPFN